MDTIENGMTTAQKLSAVHSSPEILKAVALLIVAFEETKLSSFIRFGYSHEGKRYEITFMPVTSYPDEEIEPEILP